ncbi:maleylpyruvate isomerase family mycothiol-dependent enzyme [Streptomyces sp. ST2-7A]|uniref:maleylpyruvate isomerase family mycothiol-dependent enzyme n=1 Tax=Streptomyces sp. ST2-7A TaxID=2907214 RepID=UPI001F2D7744|nr:maleylpyruvate isomerase family mycothiol-dependent enzyme [Streptomyces sp. ST2-7A]MCE7082796.1 maleylpyruvate isomerase family mycothiol-dependent enzyme [Streptomyces sp. ST2-7A]
MPEVKTAIWSVVHAERHALIQDLEDLTPQQWSVASLCDGWTVHDVLAHLIDTAKTTRIGFARRLIAARFDFDRDNAVGVVRERHGEPDRTLAAFRKVVEHTSTPPAPLATRLVEAFAHGEDIRRPLGIHRDYPPSHVAKAIRYQAKTSESFGGGKERARGCRLVATDVDLQIGDGDEVHGTAIALLLALSGRPTDSTELSGPGIPALVRRR